jgi:hypothetical protein
MSAKREKKSSSQDLRACGALRAGRPRSQQITWVVVRTHP